jgi:hypothetical protein
LNELIAFVIHGFDFTDFTVAGLLQTYTLWDLLELWIFVVFVLADSLEFSSRPISEKVSVCRFG